MGFTASMLIGKSRKALSGKVVVSCASVLILRGADVVGGANENTEVVVILVVEDVAGFRVLVVDSV